MLMTYKLMHAKMSKAGISLQCGTQTFFLFWHYLGFSRSLSVVLSLKCLMGQNDKVVAFSNQKELQNDILIPIEHFFFYLLLYTDLRRRKGDCAHVSHWARYCHYRIGLLCCQVQHVCKASPFRICSFFSLTFTSGTI